MGMTGWIVTVWCLLSLAMTAGYMVGRAFRREELTALQFHNVCLNGALQRESIRAQTAEDNARRMGARMSLEELMRYTQSARPIRGLIPANPAGLSKRSIEELNKVLPPSECTRDSPPSLAEQNGQK